MARREHDRYFTPEFATRELIDRVSIAGKVLECCAGDGAIRNVLDEIVHTVTNDIVGDCDFSYDVTKRDSWALLADRMGTIDWVVTNPTFRFAPQIIPLAFECARVGIAMQLRLSYLEPCENDKTEKQRMSRRGKWLSENKKYLSNLIILPRISYTNDGRADNVTCAWFVWRKDHDPELGCDVDFVLKNGVSAPRASAA